MRAILYVDGFNIYHAIDDLGDSRLKWLSLRDLASKILRSRSEALERVVYFSAYADYLTPTDPSKVARHKLYVSAIESSGVDVVLGNFKRKLRRCRRCGATWDSHEEKETDVNIAVRLVSDAYSDRFDVAYVLTADTDLAPAMRCVRTVEGPDAKLKQVVAVFPPGRDRYVNVLRGNSDRQISLNRAHIETCRLPDVMVLPDSSQISCPPEYL